MLHWLACVCTLDLSCIGLSFVRTLPPPTGVLAKLKSLDLTQGTQITDAGCAALVAPPPPAGAPPPPAGVLTKLKLLSLSCTQVTDAGCATLVAALDSGALPALRALYLDSIRASAAAIAAVYEAHANLKDPHGV